MDIPAGLDNVVTVGSVNDNDFVSSFSNKGNNVIDIYATGGGSHKLATVGYQQWANDKAFEKEWVIVPTLEGKYTYAYGTSIQHQRFSSTWVNH